MEWLILYWLKAVSVVEYCGGNKSRDRVGKPCMQVGQFDARYQKNKRVLSATESGFHLHASYIGHGFEPLYLWMLPLGASINIKGGGVSKC